MAPFFISNYTPNETKIVASSNLGKQFKREFIISIKNEYLISFSIKMLPANCQTECIFLQFDI